MLNSAQQPLWPGCKTTSELSAAITMLSLKSKHNMSQACFNDVMKFMKESSHPENVIPSNFRETKKLVAGLGLLRIKIDYCIDGCMLYYKDDSTLRQCKFCEKPRYKARNVSKKNSKDVPYKRLHYLPLIPRLQRLYASVRSAEHMRWHYENRREEGVLCHPSDGEAWKHFDKLYPEFASEPRNVRLGLCVDGFTPFSQSITPYSCWPIIVTPYNLPPKLCMIPPYMFLSLINAYRQKPKGKIDQNFRLRATLIWTIHDFPTNGMLFRWSTTRKLACSFLPHNHAFRRNNDAFYKNRIEENEPPSRLSEYCNRKELLLKNPNGNYVKPKAKFCLSNEQKNDVCEWVKGLKMPDGYASNISRCVDIKSTRLFGMKSHDCHIFMECLLPIALSVLPEPIWKPLTELSQFFKDLCSTVLRKDHLLQMEQNIPIIL
ncbi:hypothetical protein CR513_16860, partial [Mucuna pruriens]